MSNDDSTEQGQRSDQEVIPICPHDPSCDWHSPDRRKDHMEWHHNVDRRLNDGAATMKALRDELAENTIATKLAQADAEHTKNSTIELVALLDSFKGAMRVLEMIGKAARPIGYIAAAVAGGITAFKAVMGLLALLKGGGGPTP